jgi:uncharacterized protein (TIGR00661 family)
VKILYGVCGEGLGHASRSRILIHYLQQQKHEVCIIVGGKTYTILSKEFSKEPREILTRIKEELQRIFKEKKQCAPIHLANNETYQNKFSLSDRYAFEVFVQNHLILLYGG